ncbi:hypothetical protein OF83DRAFT_889601 [Amylostereum chailletii]|nr:hypothetical protein OF83DRAFT_889601 [Amylostereum chailletii]
MIPQFKFVAELIVYAGERIGTVVESERYHDFNQGIEWCDTAWWIVPNAHDPARPYVLVYLRLRLLKNSRTNESKTKTIVLVVNHLEKRATCSLASLLTLALYDRIFARVSSAEEIFNPVHPPSQAHILSIQPHMQHVSILREEVFDPATATTTISPDRTLKYMTFAKHLRWAGLQAGLPDPVKAMDAHNTAANLFGQEMSVDDRAALQAHSPRFSTYFLLFSSPLPSPLADCQAETLHVPRPDHRPSRSRSWPYPGSGTTSACPDASVARMLKRARSSGETFLSGANTGMLEGIAGAWLG